MAYSKTTWAANDVITATKLNKMEQGIYDAQRGGGALIVGSEYDDNESKYTLNKTWQEIYNAVSQGIVAVIVYETPIDGYAQALPVLGAYQLAPTQYGVSVSLGDAMGEYTADQASGYPSMAD